MIYTRNVVLPCQVFTLIDDDTGQFLLIGCGSWACDKCGPRKIARFVKRVERIPQTYEYLKFLTLTYAGPVISNAIFNKRVGRFFRLLRERYGKFEFTRVNERGAKTNRLHTHCIANLPFISNWRYGKAEFAAMAKAAGLGWVKINARPRQVAREYLTKYMHKGRHFPWRRYERWHQSSMGLAAIPRKRHVNNWSVHRSIINFEQWARWTVRRWEEEMEISQLRAAGCECYEPLRYGCDCGVQRGLEAAWLSSLPPASVPSSPLNSKLTGKIDKLDDGEEDVF